MPFGLLPRILLQQCQGELHLNDWSVFAGLLSLENLEEWLDFHITTYLAQQPSSKISNGIVAHGDKSTFLARQGVV